MQADFLHAAAGRPPPAAAPAPNAILLGAVGSLGEALMAGIGHHDPQLALLNGGDKHVADQTGIVRHGLDEQHPLTIAGFLESARRNLRQLAARRQLLLVLVATVISPR